MWLVRLEHRRCERLCPRIQTGFVLCDSALNRLSFARDEKLYSTAELRQVFAACDGPVSCAEIIAGDRPMPSVTPVKSDNAKTVAQAENKPTRRRR